MFFHGLWRIYCQYLFTHVFFTACGGIISGENGGVIENPGYPGVYPTSTNCTWTVVVRPGRTIRLSTEGFSLPAGSQGQCNADYVQVINLAMRGPSLYVRI